LDRERLARRNQRLAAALRKPSPKHQLPNLLLTLLARAPASPRAQIAFSVFSRIGSPSGQQARIVCWGGAVRGLTKAAGKRTSGTLEKRHLPS